MNRSLMWALVGETGLEQLHLRQQKNTIVADGLVLLKEQNVPLRVHYIVRCDGTWLTEITVDADGLVIDYPGIWQRV